MKKNTVLILGLAAVVGAGFFINKRNRREGLLNSSQNGAINGAGLDTTTAITPNSTLEQNELSAISFGPGLGGAYSAAFGAIGSLDFSKLLP